jgi:antitoxin MazE
MTRAAVARWGNSLAVRIPKGVAEGAKLGEGTSVELVQTPDGLLLRPARVLTLDSLLEQVTDENRHGEVESGDVVGQEVW